MEEPTAPTVADRGPSSGCIQGALAAGTVIWILTASGAALFGGWLMEQLLFEGSLTTSDYRWLIQLAYAASLLIPLGLINVVLRQADRRMYLSWMLAAGFSILVIPARMLQITQSQGVTALQAGGLLLLCLVLVRMLRDQGRFSFRRQTGVGLAAALGLLLMLPWILYGALGSILDVVLGALTAALFGAAASLAMQAGIYAPHPRKANVGSAGLAALVMLLIFVTGLGQNGTQWLLLMSLPAAAWAMAAFGRGQEEDSEQPAQWAAPAALIGLAAAGPLLFIDPDEMMLVISSAQGDLLGWAMRAAALSLAVGALLSMAAGLTYRSWHARTASPVLSTFPPLAAAVLALAAYAAAGQPGLHGERLFVIFSQQAELSAALEGIEDVPARRAAVYQALVANAEGSQAPLRALLDQFGISYWPYYLVNGLEVSGGPLVRVWLEAQPGVDRVLPSPQLRPLPEGLQVSRGTASAPGGSLWNLEMIRAPLVWEELGVTGEGVVVGQSDSGVQGDHPELAGTFVGGERAWFDPWFGSQSPQDFGGHGTHTLGSILGSQTGVAPGASWIGCVNLARNLGNPALYLDCMQFMLAPFPSGGDPFHDGDPAQGADVLNNSWGCPGVEGCDAGVFAPAVHALREAGIFMVVSAGNSGYNGCGSVKDPPAIYAEVYSVGSVNSQGMLSEFSSRGPVTVDGSRRVKPDILAPGEEVTSSFPGSTYETTSGTSMAGPHVTGVVALMWSANPVLVGRIDATETILNQTAQPYENLAPLCTGGSGLQKNGIGYGVVDAYAAVEAALEYTP